MDPPGAHPVLGSSLESRLGMVKNPPKEPGSERQGDTDVQRVLRTQRQCRNYYNKLSRSYDILADRTEAPLRRKGLELLAAAPGETVLEVGSGTGRSLAELATTVGDQGLALGVDLAEGMTLQTRRRLDRLGLNTTAFVACGDALRLPLRNRCIDALYSSFCLELFDTPDIPRMLAECRRVLKPGGRAVVVSLSRHSEEFAVRAYEWTHRHFPNLFDCRPIHVEDSLRAAGFRISRSILEHMWVPVEIVLATNSS